MLFFNCKFSSYYVWSVEFGEAPYHEKILPLGAVVLLLKEMLLKCVSSERLSNKTCAQQALFLSTIIIHDHFEADLVYDMHSFVD